jgi:calcium-dependent protein kinase
VASITHQILSAVSYFHEKNIVHRDVKLENIIFENERPDSIIKIIDFGWSKEYSPKDHILSERVGTLYSMSPETMLGNYASQADVWSIGVCTYMMLAAGQKPFDGKTSRQMVAKILLGKYDLESPAWMGISRAAKQFVRDLLVVEPNDRWTAAAAKQHPWLVDSYQHKLVPSSEDHEDFKDRVRECIVRYADLGDFVKLALNVIAKKSTSEEIFALRSVFDEFDTENKGTLSLAEFKAALGHFDMYSEEEIEEIFHKIVSPVGVSYKRDDPFVASPFLD